MHKNYSKNSNTRNLESH